MPPDRSAGRRRAGSHRPPTGTGPTGRAAGRSGSGAAADLRAAWPHGPVEVPTGTVELVPDPDHAAGVTLLVNGVPSSYVDLDDPGVLAFEYMQQMALVIDTLRPGTPLDVVHLGAGGCALARALDVLRPGSRQLAVELDTRLPELARLWFGLPRAPALRIRAGDARAELERLGTATTDVVVRDVFAGDRTPAHLTTIEAARAAARVLRPGGVYLVNCADRPPLALARSEAATLGRVFADVVVIAEPALLRGRGYGNLVLAATDDPALLAVAGLARAVRTLPAPARLLRGEEVAAFAAGAPVLHDPVTGDGTRDAAP
ncbi:methyltransferase type 11 [Cellulomonas gilvus ATCC 13127]|uniref:Methyltransferase type 11 n=1 Tax=Cellulomonas gilvus (strain ATCC 13127 / NRRL B-14078) TaxID=593907 RepID=F7ZZ95_CELGA|nr:methyltransferase type 11 [Cellulomonas gilvus ATCC 13127]